MTQIMLALTYPVRTPYEYIRKAVLKKYGFARWLRLFVGEPIFQCMVGVMIFSLSCWIIYIAATGTTKLDVPLPDKVIVNDMGPAVEKLRIIDAKKDTMTPAAYHVLRAKVLSDFEMFDEAEREYCMLYQTNRVRYQHTYGDAYLIPDNMIKAGRVEQGKAFFERLLKDFPGNWNIRHRFAVILVHSRHRSARDPDKAIKLVTETLAFNGGLRKAVLEDHLVLADAYAAKGDFKKAMTFIEKMSATYKDVHAQAILKGRRDLFLQESTYLARHL